MTKGEFSLKKILHETRILVAFKYIKVEMRICFLDSNFVLMSNTDNVEENFHYFKESIYIYISGIVLYKL